MKFSKLLSKLFESKENAIKINFCDSYYFKRMVQIGLVQTKEDSFTLTALGESLLSHYQFIEGAKLSFKEMAVILEIYAEGSQFLNEKEISDSLKSKGLVSYRGCNLYVLTGKARSFSENVTNQIKSFLK